MITLPVIDPFAPESPMHDGGAFLGQSVVEGPYGFAVLDYALASSVLRDNRFQNSALRLMEEFGIVSGPAHDSGPKHHHARGQTTPAAPYSPGSVHESGHRAAYSFFLRDIVSGIVADLDDSKPVEFHAAVDRRLPSLVYCHLAGAPASDAPKVQSLSEGTLALLSRDPKTGPFNSSGL